MTKKCGCHLQNLRESLPNSGTHSWRSHIGLQHRPRVRAMAMFDRWRTTLRGSGELKSCPDEKARRGRGQTEDGEVTAPLQNRACSAQGRGGERDAWHS